MNKSLNYLAELQVPYGFQLKAGVPKIWLAHCDKTTTQAGFLDQCFSELGLFLGEKFPNWESDTMMCSVQLGSFGVKVGLGNGDIFLSGHKTIRLLSVNISTFHSMLLRETGFMFR